MNSKQPEKQILYIYNEFSYEPIARVINDVETDSQTIHYYHTLLNSLPTELTDEEGDIVWRADYTLFGKLKRQQKRYDDIGEQNLRFAGQYYDKDKLVGNKFEQRASVGPLGRVSG